MQVVFYDAANTDEELHSCEMEHVPRVGDKVSRWLDLTAQWSGRVESVEWTLKDDEEYVEIILELMYK